MNTLAYHNETRCVSFSPCSENILGQRHLVDSYNVISKMLIFLIS